MTTTRNFTRVGALLLLLALATAGAFAQEDMMAAAVVTFYGSGPITDPAQLGAMEQAAPVLGVFGAEDGNIPVSEVRAFEEALGRRNIEHTITIYDGVGHAFVGSENYDAGGTATEAWNQLLAFLEENV